MKLKRDKLYQFNDDDWYYASTSNSEDRNLNYIGIAIKDYKLKVIMSNTINVFAKIGDTITYNKFKIKEYIKSGRLVKID
jgi:hypothetical protein